MRLPTRLLLGALAVVAMLAVVLTFEVDQKLAERLTAEATDGLAREARLVASEWTPGVDPVVLAEHTGIATGHRVTLIDSTGVVIGDSEFRGSARLQLENHAHRPEVMAARATGMGSSRRRSPSAGDLELYVAVRAARGTARVSLTTSSLDAIIMSAKQDVAVASAVAMLGALVLAGLFARDVSRPVRELRDVARALADGDFTRRPALAAPGEVGELADAVHRLAEQLATRVEALRSEETLMRELAESLNEGIFAVDARGHVVRINETCRALLGRREALPFPSDILPRERALRDAIASALGGETVRDVEATLAGRTFSISARPLDRGGAVVALLDLTRLRRLETVRRDFVSNVSHELKTPLTVVRGFAETLVHDDPETEVRRKFVGTILSNTRRMQRIVDDLLDLSRIESGGWVPQPVETDVAAAAADALLAARPAAELKGLALTTELAADATTCFADPTAIRQVLGNLVDNAVRHTARGGVTVFSRREGGLVAVGVRDTGSGIPAEHLPRIFERFYRVDPARSREEGGTGLGLAIVKHLVESHGGRVRAESTVGAGTSIMATFPDAAARG
ncbi:MAG: HAMP domain-containing protein [Gemmatimonadetes bacterium]|nr:HAMP domain-containing protein [Gemmatimonadota bacterium]